MFAQGGSTISEVIKNPNESIGSFLTQTSKFNEAVMKKPVDGQKSMAFAEFATSDIRLAASMTLLTHYHVFFTAIWKRRKIIRGIILLIFT
jgi:hypothetical protein